MDKIKILFVGNLNEYSRSFQRFQALQRIDHKVKGLSSVFVGEIAGFSQRLTLTERIRHKLGRHLDKVGINKSLPNEVAKFQPNILWIEKALPLKSSVLSLIKKEFPDIHLVHCCEDDMYAKHNSSVYFRMSVPFFDIIFTTKTYNCNSEELPSLGAKRVEIFKNCYDPTLHKAVDPCEEYESGVSFIGTFEKERAELCLFLAQNGISVRVWGNGWNAYKNRSGNLIIEDQALYNHEFVKALCSSKINLCFLRKINRDLQTSRSVEIPACGAFMLAERTNEHLELFEENSEAAFFDVNNPDELLDKVRYYLMNNIERERIAKAGRDRSLKSGYSHDEELKRMITVVTGC